MFFWSSDKSAPNARYGLSLSLITTLSSALSLAAAGFGIAVGFQSFLSIGGVIKFIPSTGVTLPFISAGGSSTIAFFIMFSCIQGMGMKKEVKA